MSWQEYMLASNKFEGNDKDPKYVRDIQAYYRAAKDYDFMVEYLQENELPVQVVLASMVREIQKLRTLYESR